MSIASSCCFYFVLSDKVWSFSPYLESADQLVGVNVEKTKILRNCFNNLFCVASIKSPVLVKVYSHCLCACGHEHMHVGRWAGGWALVCCKIPIALQYILCRLCNPQELLFLCAYVN